MPVVKMIPDYEFQCQRFGIKVLFVTYVLMQMSKENY